MKWNWLIRRSRCGTAMLIWNYVNVAFNGIYVRDDEGITKFKAQVKVDIG